MEIYIGAIGAIAAVFVVIFGGRGLIDLARGYSERRRSARGLVWRIAILVPLLLVLAFHHGSAHAAGFGLGDTVEVYNTGSQGLVVRGPSACGGQIGGKFDVDRGEVLEAPVFCNGFNRWKIRWEDGLVGWSAENWLRKVTTLLPAPTLSSPFSG